MMGNPRTVRKPDEAEKPRKFSKASAKLLMTVPIVIVPAAKAAANVFSSDKEIKIESKVLNPDFIDFSKVKIKLQKEILRIDATKEFYFENIRDGPKSWDTLYANVIEKNNKTKTITMEEALVTIKSMDQSSLSSAIENGKQVVTDGKQFVAFDIGEALEKRGLSKNYTFNSTQGYTINTFVGGFFGTYFVNKPKGEIIAAFPGNFLTKINTSDGKAIMKDCKVDDGTLFFVSTNSFGAISNSGDFRGTFSEKFGADPNMQPPIELTKGEQKNTAVLQSNQLYSGESYVKIIFSIENDVLRLLPVSGKLIDKPIGGGE